MEVKLTEFLIALVKDIFLGACAAFLTLVIVLLAGTIIAFIKNVLEAI